MILSLNIKDKVFAIFNYIVYTNGVTDGDTILLYFSEGGLSP